MRTALCVVCWLVMIAGLITLLFEPLHMNNIIAAGVMYIPTLWSLVYLATHKD